MNAYKRILCFLTVLAMAVTLTACGGPSADYPDAASFEAALNSGENPEGKTVQFTVGDMIPNTALGYNVQAGEHLNFISSINPDVQAGDIMTVKVGTVVSLFGTWLIQYEKLSSKAGTPSPSGSTAPEENTGSGSEPTEQPNSTYTPAPSFTPEPAETPRSLELVDHGFCVSSTSGDTAYIDFCGMVYNPNETLIATFPEVLVTVKNGDGTILATDSQTGSLVMPGDTVTICGMFSLPTANITDDTMIYYDVDWSDMDTDTFIYSGAKTTDFEITNVSSQSSSRKNLITGEITNNYSEDVDSVNLSVILRKDGKIVYIDNTFVDSLKIGKPKAFQISSYHDWPEYDTIDISPMAR